MLRHSADRALLSLPLIRSLALPLLVALTGAAGVARAQGSNHSRHGNFEVQARSGAYCAEGCVVTAEGRFFYRPKIVRVGLGVGFGSGAVYFGFGSEVGRFEWTTLLVIGVLQPGEYNIGGEGGLAYWLSERVAVGVACGAGHVGRAEDTPVGSRHGSPPTRGYWLAPTAGVTYTF